MKHDKDLGFADRYILYDSSTVKVVKLIYKGNHAVIGEQTQVCMFDNDGYVSKRMAQFNNNDWFTMAE